MKKSKKKDIKRKVKHIKKCAESLLGEKKHDCIDCELIDISLMCNLILEDLKKEPKNYAWPLTQREVNDLLRGIGDGNN